MLNSSQSKKLLTLETHPSPSTRQEMLTGGVKKKRKNSFPKSFLKWSLEEV
jgi:hypothetical protein